MSYTPLNEIFKIYNECNKVATIPEDIEVGDLYIAYQRNRPLKQSLRFFWDIIESIAPSVLKVVIWIVIKFRISIKVSPNRAEGNRYAGTALERGARFAIVDVRKYFRGKRILLVRDTRETLIGLAKLHRKNLEIPIISITGSNGKTTSKELVYSILIEHLKCRKTKNVSNSIAAISRTILSIKEKTDVAVLEMGIMAGGELADMCEVARPTHGLITNIGSAHLKNLGSLEGVKKAKGELFAFLRSTGGHIFLNLDDEHVRSLAGDYEHVTTYGQREGAFIRGLVIESNPCIRVRWFLPRQKAGTPEEYVDIQTRFVGDHYLSQVLSAIAVGYYFKVPQEKIVSAIEEFQPLENRSQLIQIGSNTIILDAYNANPSSVSAAIATLASMPQKEKIIILGDMLDLGKQSKDAHRGIVQNIKSNRGIKAVFVGKEFSRVRAEDAGMYFKKTEDARRWFRKQQFDNCCILVKGSRAMRMETLLEE